MAKNYLHLDSKERKKSVNSFRKDKTGKYFEEYV